MKKILTIIGVIVVILFALDACKPKTALEQVAGRWVMASPSLGTLDVTINEDGTGKYVYFLSYPVKKGEWPTFLEDVEFTEEGNDLYFNLKNQRAHLYVKDGVLYGHDGQPFEKYTDSFYNQ